MSGRILVTGGAGVIGSAVCRRLISDTDCQVLNLDKLTYAGNLKSVQLIAEDPRYTFVRGDICDATLVSRLLNDFRPDAIMHLAAETHVDRSIAASREFIQTNVMGTHVMLQASLDYFERMDAWRQSQFRFLAVSTDEVFGTLGEKGAFDETSAYAPRSPYSASKAASDHLARAWYATYELPVVVSNCSNNYGPYQYPENLIPLMITNAMRGKSLPVYGTGANVRDWLHVDDHAEALVMLVRDGLPGETYCIGGGEERANLDVVRQICSLLDKIVPRSNGQGYDELISFVEDRRGHDYRYAIDDTKMRETFDWTPKRSFESGLEETVRWYLEKGAWWSGQGQVS